MTVFVFSAWAIKAVGVAAEEVIKEVRRQFKEHPGILTYEEKPNYKECVSIVAAAGLRQMIKPGILSVASPIITGVTFRIGSANILLLGFIKLYTGEFSLVSDEPFIILGVILLIYNNNNLNF